MSSDQDPAIRIPPKITIEYEANQLKMDRGKATMVAECAERESETKIPLMKSESGARCHSCQKQSIAITKTETAKMEELQKDGQERRRINREKSQKELELMENESNKRIE
ncbi:hypothetical protein IFR05_012831 [Cadophora sp. M221]|nr:hypothetical protein IFR05_012831 [Cadophora sp. M221]